jgi:hypothetical protein
MPVGKSGNNNSAMGAPISPSHDTLFPGNLQGFAGNKLNNQQFMMMGGAAQGSAAGGLFPTNQPQ